MEKIAHITQVGLETAKCFRLGYEGAANEAFVSFIDNVTLLCQENKNIGIQLSDILAVIINAQKRQDTLFIADIIQYEILPFLNEQFPLPK